MGTMVQQNQKHGNVEEELMRVTTSLCNCHIHRCQWTMETICLSPTILQGSLVGVHLNLGNSQMAGQRNHILANSLLYRVINSPNSDSHLVAVADGEHVQKTGRWFTRWNAKSPITLLERNSFFEENKKVWWSLFLDLFGRPAAAVLPCRVLCSVTKMWQRKSDLCNRYSCDLMGKHPTSKHPVRG